MNSNAHFATDERARTATHLGVPEGARNERARGGTRLWPLTRLGVDVALLAFAALIADFSSPQVDTFGDFVLWPAAFAAMAIGLSLVRGAYARRVRLDVPGDLGNTISVLAVALSVLVAVRSVAEPGSAPAIAHSIRLGVLAVVCLGSGRIVLDFWQLSERRLGKAAVPTLIVGAGEVGRKTARRLLESPELGLKPIGFLDKEPRENAGDFNRLPVLGASWDLDRVVAEHGVGQVIVTFSTAPSEVLLQIIRRCDELGVEVAVVPRLFEKASERLTIDYLGGLPLVTAHRSNPRGWPIAVKYGLDRLFAFALVCLLAPVMLACAVAVWISHGRPILFRQRRVGRDGRVFEMLKFRSITRSASPPPAASDFPDDIAPGGVNGFDRISKVGALLRDTSLDELPQLFNVLKGEMSLVGPRPERPEYVELFESQVNRYGDRHRVKSGITGWAQVNGLRGNTSLTDRIEWDNYYIENRSLKFDLRILGLTMLTLCRVPPRQRASRAQPDPPPMSATSAYRLEAIAAVEHTRAATVGRPRTPA